MDIENVEKYLTFYHHPTHTEVIYSGQPCLSISESSEGFAWNIVPVFAKLVYGAQSYADIPYCMEIHPGVAEAAAEGISRLHELGAFNEVDFELADDIEHSFKVNECYDLSFVGVSNILEAYENVRFYSELSEGTGGVTPPAVRNFHRSVLDASKTEGKTKEAYMGRAKELFKWVKDHPKVDAKVMAKYHKMTNESEEADDLEALDENAFDWKSTKSASSSYHLPGHVVLDVKNHKDETHVKRINADGQVTVTKYKGDGSVKGREHVGMEDPSPHFPKAKEEPKEKRGRGRPSANTDPNSRYAKYKDMVAAKAAGTWVPGKRGRKPKAATNEEVLDEISGTTLKNYIMKAASDKYHSGMDAGSAIHNKNTTDSQEDKNNKLTNAFKKSGKRGTGILRALNRMKKDD